MLEWEHMKFELFILSLKQHIQAVILVRHSCWLITRCHKNRSSMFRVISQRYLNQVIYSTRSTRDSILQEHECGFVLNAEAKEVFKEEFGYK